MMHEERAGIKRPWRNRKAHLHYGPLVYTALLTEIVVPTTESSASMSGCLCNRVKPAMNFARLSRDRFVVHLNLDGH